MVVKGAELVFRKAPLYHDQIAPIERQKRSGDSKLAVLPDCCLQFKLDDEGRLAVFDLPESRLKVSDLSLQDGYVFEGDFWLVLKDKSYDPRETYPFSLCIPFIDGVIQKDPNLFKLTALKRISSSKSQYSKVAKFLEVDWMKLFQRHSEVLWKQKEKLRIKLKKKRRSELGIDDKSGMKFSDLEWMMSFRKESEPLWKAKEQLRIKLKDQRRTALSSNSKVEGNDV